MRNIKPIKQLGQHFLHNIDVIQQIIILLKGVWKDEIILEIGPGMGALTKYILPEFHEHLQVVELDRRCVEYLQNNFPELNNKIIEGDFLKMDIKKIFSQQTIVIGNFPYNISSQILFKILENHEKVPVMIGMFQKEVAARIASGPGNKDYGILSVLTQFFYEAKIAFDIQPSSFTPPPRVMSSMLVLTKKQTLPEGVDYKILRTVVKTGFNQRRKKLRNALSGIFSTEILEQPIFQKRAEELSLEDFIGLTKLPLLNSDK